MTVLTESPAGQAPEWLAAEMPPGYQTRLLEIQRLSADLQGMDRIGRVLWETGGALRGAIGELFGALKCAVELEPGAVVPIAVRLDLARRLLLIVSDSPGPIQKTDEELATAFRALQFAAAGDRVVLVPGNEPATPPAGRPEPVHPDALDVMRRMGVAAITTPDLFRLWRLSHEDPKKARQALDRLHALDGGVFALSAR